MRTMFLAANNSRARLTAVSNRHAKQLSKTHLRALSTKVVLRRETTFALRFLSAQVFHGFEGAPGVPVLYGSGVIWMNLGVIWE